MIWDILGMVNGKTLLVATVVSAAVVWHLIRSGPE